jgi:hypothetical protein
LVDPLGLCDKEKCTAARALSAALGEQFKSDGQKASLAGIATVGISGFAALMAPEAAPWEAAGGEAGVGMINVGGALSALGSALVGYSRGGLRAGAVAGLRSVAIDLAAERASGLIFSTHAGKTAFGALEVAIPEALQAQEAACE